jgi:hypothetical protein
MRAINFARNQWTNFVGEGAESFGIACMEERTLEAVAAALSNPHKGALPSGPSGEGIPAAVESASANTQQIRSSPSNSALQAPHISLSMPPVDENGTGDYGQVEGTGGGHIDTADATQSEKTPITDVERGAYSPY